MKLVPLKYVGPHDEVEIAATGQVCKRGETVDVPAELAGRAPSIKETDDGAEVADHGEGLLAQTSNWQPGKSAGGQASAGGDKAKPDTKKES